VFIGLTADPEEAQNDFMTAESGHGVCIGTGCLNGESDAAMIAVDQTRWEVLGMELSMALAGIRTFFVPEPATSGRSVCRGHPEGQEEKDRLRDCHETT